MGRKRKKKEEVVIWCYYCDRIFSDENTLIQHQKAKHFKCDACNKKLTSSSGLATHSYQVHKISISSVPNAILGRESMDVQIFGMAGVPEGMQPGGVIQEPAAEDPSKVARTDTAAAEAHGAYAAMPPGMHGMPGMPPPYGYAPYPGYMPYPGVPPPGPYGYAPPPYGMPPPGFPPRLGMPPFHRPPYGAPPPPGNAAAAGAAPSSAAAGAPGYQPQPGGYHVPGAGAPPGMAGGPPPGQGGAPLFPIGQPQATAPAAANGAGAQPGGGGAAAGAMAGQPLFPAGAGRPPPSAAPGQAAGGAVVVGGQLPGGGAAGGAATGGVANQPAGAAAAAAPAPAVKLIWADESLSMEEVRAMQPKYAAHTQPAVGHASGY